VWARSCGPQEERWARMAADTGPGRGELADVGLLLRARRHAALGEPVRLAMVGRLLQTDASPGELGAVYGLATNVLAHHVKVLQAAGLVRRVRSEGDARRAYLQLRRDDPEVMSLLGPALAGAAPRWLEPADVGSGPQRVVFVCTHNSARSQLAAASWRQVSPLPAATAGTHPAPRVHPRAVAVGGRHGLHLAGARTAHLGDVVADGDLLVCVCDNAHEELSAPAGRPVTAPAAGRVHWAVPDPVRADTDAAFEAAYAEIVDRVERLAHTLHPTPGAGVTQAGPDATGPGDPELSHSSKARHPQ
jgi:ArsR family transcriptional regulator, arsenate/arsenite/antimonite-responsive transcriptional repressor / arsenate reductase (thioredoxin)